MSTLSASGAALGLNNGRVKSRLENYDARQSVKDDRNPIKQRGPTRAETGCAIEIGARERRFESHSQISHVLCPSSTLGGVAQVANSHIKAGPRFIRPEDFQEHFFVN